MSDKITCVGCYDETEGAVAFVGGEEWQLAALMVICDCEIPEARATLAEFRKASGRFGYAAKLFPAVGTEVPRTNKITVACCQRCGDRGHFRTDLLPDNQVHAYVEPGFLN